MKNLSWIASTVFVSGIAASGCVIDPTYTYCASSSECQVREHCAEVVTGGTRGNFCTASCTSNADCERNLGFPGSCLAVGDQNLCFQECGISTDCFSSSDCLDFTDSVGTTNRVCVPTRLAPAYTYCASSSECVVGGLCLEVTSSATSGAFCSQECGTDSECALNRGFPGSCMNVDGLGGICFQECEFGSDCSGTSGCFDYTDSTGFTNRVCLPTRL